MSASRAAGAAPILSPIMAAVERQLAAFYGFPIASAAAGHLISRDDLRACLGDDAGQHPGWGARGGVWLLNTDAADDVFIGIHIDEEVAERLAQADPLAQLDNRNLDPFCVLVEEVSHFHLILNRAQAARTVTRLELEWQAEIDKLLICAQTLERQSGDPHLLPLARVLYDHATIDAEDSELYWEATKHAARFWFEALRADEDLTLDAVRPTLREVYRTSWPRKFDVLLEGHAPARRRAS
jgi:hypothetical protein